jgi:hypothetical protein
VVGDFTWKDPAAAQRVGMSMKDYVIGGMDKSFKKKLYYALRAMDEAGHMPGITSAFRDDYRQAIAVGKKAASDSSFHGGSRRGGYGHGMAVDLVSVKGATRMQRFASSVELWKWIDANEKTLGVGRPYLDRDPPHVTPIDGREYVAKRGGAGIAKAAAHRKTAGKVARLAKAARKVAGRSKLVQHAAAQSKAAQAKAVQQAVAQAKPAPKPVTETKLAPKPVGQAKPAPRPMVQGKPAPKPVVQSKPAQKPIVQSKPTQKPVAQTKPAPNRKVVATSAQNPREEAKPGKPAKSAKVSSQHTRGTSSGDWLGILARLRQAVAGGASS